MAWPYPIPCRALRQHARRQTLRTQVATIKADLSHAYHMSLHDEADAAHEALIATEWQLRAVERSIQR